MHGVIPTSWSVVDPNDGLAVAIEDALLSIKSHTHRDDTLVADWIKAATAYFFEQTGRSPLIQGFEYTLDQFPVQSKIELPFPPLVEVNSVQYLNADGDLVDFNDGGSPAEDLWEAKTPAGIYAPRGWIQLKYGQTWPATQAVPGAVRIEFDAGYGDTSDSVNELVKTVIRQTVGDFDRFRANSFIPITGSAPMPVPLGIEALIRGFKYSALQTTVPRSCL